MATWTPPAELTQPIPRRVRTRWAYRNVLLLGGCFSFLELIQLAASLATYSRFEPLASEPMVHYIVGDPRRDLANQIFIPLGFPASVIPFYSLYSNERGLLRRGTAAAAEILSEVGVPITDGYTTEITYQFTDQTGQIVRGIRRGFPSKYAEGSKSVTMRAKLLGGPTVLFDPANSQKNMIYPGVMATCE